MSKQEVESFSQAPLLMDGRRKKTVIKDGEAVTIDGAEQVNARELEVRLPGKVMKTLAPVVKLTRMMLKAAAIAGKARAAAPTWSGHWERVHLRR